MDELDERVTIKFYYKDEIGAEYMQGIRTPVFCDLGYTAKDELGRQMITFLRHIGFPIKNDLMLMEDLTEDELEYLLCALDEYRNNSDEVKN